MYKSQPKLFVALVTVALLIGCVTPAKNGGNVASSGADSTADPCSLGSSAAAGALTGALLGALTAGKNGLAKGAVLGGAAGAILCVGINAQSRQTKTASQVEKDYQQSRGALPRDPVLLSYSPQLAEVTRRGQPVKLASSVELVNGTVQSVYEVREELQVTDTEGRPFKSGSKPLNINSAGRFENTFELKLPENAPQGAYGLKTRLFVNGKLAATRDLKTQLVRNERNEVMFASVIQN